MPVNISDMTIEEAIQYINNHTWSSSRLGLERTEELLNALGNPQKELKFVHVAGTNGKGSTSAMIAEILKESGYRVGLYPSPFIETFNERIQVNGELISDEDLARITDTVSRAADSMEDHPSQFEMITAIGMLYFKEKNCDIIVLEVGMGGRLDSTNVIEAPEACVITNIGYDHMEYLGDTLEKIAAEKAGIIKVGSDVIVYPNDENVIAVIKDKCASTHAVLHETKGLTEPVKAGKAAQSPNYVDKDRQGLNSANIDRKNLNYQSLNGQLFRYKGELYELSLLGAHQIKNAGVAIKTVEVLARKGYNISHDAIRRGLKSVRWPARFEVLGRDPLFILDGGHNPQCAEAFAQSLRDYVPGGKAVLIIGMLKDKDYDQVISILKERALAYICITPDSPRALPNTELAAEIRRLYAVSRTMGCNNFEISCEVDDYSLINQEAVSRDIDGEALKEEDSVSYPIIRTADTISEAIDIAISFGQPVAAFGSLYSAGEIRREYRRRGAR